MVHIFNAIEQAFQSKWWCIYDRITCLQIALCYKVGRYLRYLPTLSLRLICRALNGGGRHNSRPWVPSPILPSDKFPVDFVVWMNDGKEWRGAVRVWVLVLYSQDSSIILYLCARPLPEAALLRFGVHWNNSLFYVLSLVIHNKVLLVLLKVSARSRLVCTVR